MAESPEKQPVPKTTSDLLTAEKSVQFKWEQRRFHQFRRKAAQKKLRAVTKELEDAKKNVRFFTDGLSREFDAHPDVFKKMGLSRAMDEDDGD
jgi:hypothetical protein